MPDPNVDVVVLIVIGRAYLKLIEVRYQWRIKKLRFFDLMSTLQFLKVHQLAIAFRIVLRLKPRQINMEYCIGHLELLP